VSVGPLGCEVARRRRVPGRGVALSLLEAGRPGRPPVCLLHGGAAHAHWFDAVLPGLAARHHVVAVDQRGHGESGWPSPPAYASEDFAADLLAVMDALGWVRMALVGHSMGGHVAMAFAAWHPERLDALAIVDSRPALPPDRLARLRARGRRPHRRHATLEEAVAAFRLLPPETVADRDLLEHVARAAYVPVPDGPGREAWILRFDPAGHAHRRPVDAWPLLPAIRARTLVVRGEHSPILPGDMAARIGELVPDARLVEIPGVHHHLMLDHPERFGEALLGFLAG
jgi:pimeloyl-ACP methyl ester carboxylesterase